MIRHFFEQILLEAVPVRRGSPFLPEDSIGEPIEAPLAKR